MKKYKVYIENTSEEIIEQKNTVDQFQIELLKYYQDEWKFRHTHFWNLVVKFFVINIIVCYAPYVSEYLNVRYPGGILDLCCIGCGALLAFISCYILFEEAKRHNEIGVKKKIILNKIYGNEMSKSAYSKGKHLNNSIVIYMCILQFMFVIGSIILYCIK